MTKNPLLQKCSLPLFDKIKLNDIKSAIDQVLFDNRKKLTTLLQQKNFTWQNLMAPLAQMEEKLEWVFAPVSHLNSVMNSPKLRTLYQNTVEKITLYQLEMSHNVKLYHAIQSIKAAALSKPKKRVVQLYLRDFKLAGVGLSGEKKKQFLEIEQRLSVLGQTFSNHLLDATAAWQLQITNKKELSGIPPHAVAQAKAVAQKKKKAGWLFGLDMPTYLAVMSYADDRSVREKMYHAFVTRASEVGPSEKKFDNQPVIDEILRLRKELSALVGFKNYADYSLATKMAKHESDVLNFLNELLHKSKPTAKKELAELSQFAKKFKITKMQAWDAPYLSEKLQQEKFNISQEELRPYFPEEKVLFGMYLLAGKLFNVKFKEKKTAHVWHPDVKYFEVFSNGKKKTGFYVDLFARPNKRSGAWMDSCGKLAFLTCNFSKPQKGKPSLLTHDEVVTLFHEFGHCLQHLLTAIKEPEIAGIHGVEWDAVELPSQMMENFCWEKKVLPLISSHYQTGESLPEEKLNQLIETKNFQAGLQMLRQLSFGLFDFHLHADNKVVSVQSLLNKIRHQTSLIKTPSYNRFQNSFSHIFAGGYAAGYYSYKWAEVLSCDAFDLFKQHGVISRKIGERFKKSILETGGSEPALVLFKQFRGRKPSIKALLEQSGIS